MSLYSIDFNDKRIIINKEDNKVYRKTVVYRIVAKNNFETILGDKIKEGDKGGYIESYSNLENDINSTCWIKDNATVYGNAIITDDALVSKNACVFGEAKVSNVSIVTDNAIVCGDTSLIGSAIITDNSIVQGNTTIKGNVVISGVSYIFSRKNVFTQSPELIEIKYYGEHEKYINFDSVVIGSNEERYIGSIEFEGENRAPLLIYNMFSCNNDNTEEIKTICTINNNPVDFNILTDKQKEAVERYIYLIRDKEYPFPLLSFA